MNELNITISKMNIADLDLIKDNLSIDFDDFWNYNILKDELSSPTSYYFVAKLNNEIVAFAGIKIIIDEAELMNIVVKKQYRGHKISLYILDYLITFCKEKNIKKINLEVNIKNTIAINLYKKYNFIQIGLRKNYYNGIDDAILMIRRIY